jgi:hypothetical protein
MLAGFTTMTGSVFNPTLASVFGLTGSTGTGAIAQADFSVGFGSQVETAVRVRSGP